MCYCKHFKSCSLGNTDQDNSDGSGSPPAENPRLSPQPNNTGTEKGKANSIPVSCVPIQLCPKRGSGVIRRFSWALRTTPPNNVKTNNYSCITTVFA